MEDFLNQFDPLDSEVDAREAELEREARLNQKVAERQQKKNEQMIGATLNQAFAKLVQELPVELQQTLNAKMQANPQKAMEVHQNLSEAQSQEFIRTLLSDSPATAKGEVKETTGAPKVAPTGLDTFKEKIQKQSLTAEEELLVVETALGPGFGSNR